LAVEVVLDAEVELGRTPREMAQNNKGYDIKSRPREGELLFIEVKGRAAGADDFDVTASEILCARNDADRHILALVEVADDDSTMVRCLYDPFTLRAEPGFAENFRNLDWHECWELAASPD
jgi:Protein NO VEIN, C-terminal